MPKPTTASIDPSVQGLVLPSAQSRPDEGVAAPNYGCLNLKQLFDASQANLALIQHTLDSESELPRRRLDKVSSTLDAVATDFWSHGYSPDPVMYLLLLMLQK